jgi:hypothetical protein
MLRNPKVATILAVGVLLSAAAVIAQNHQPAFYFGGKRIYVGMPKSEAVSVLSGCRKLSPPSFNESVARDTGKMFGQLSFPRKSRLSAFSGPSILGLERWRVSLVPGR